MLSHLSQQQGGICIHDHACTCYCPGGGAIQRVAQLLLPTASSTWIPDNVQVAGMSTAALSHNLVDHTVCFHKWWKLVPAACSLLLCYVSLMIASQR